MKKKLISLMLCGIVAISLVGCGDKEEKESNKESDNVVSIDIGDLNNKEEELEKEDKDEKTKYKAMGIDEAIKFHEEKLPEFEKYLNDNGFEGRFSELDDDLVDGPSRYGYSGSGEKGKYKNLAYSAEIDNDLVTVRYELSYYIDRAAIQSGTVEVPKARDLLIAEPYKIMTGDEISEELLDKIDEAIEYGCLNDNVDKVTLEENGPFKINVRVDGIDVTFQIISDGDGKGN